MLLLATALVSLGRRYGRAVAACAVAALVVAEVGWAYEKTPQLFTGDPSARVAAREAAGRWLAATSRPDDVFFGYEPLYLEASKSDDDVAHIVIPRADAKLAAARLDALPRPLGRGVWVFDAYDTNNCTCTRGLTIEERLPPGRATSTKPACSVRSSCSARVSRRGRPPSTSTARRR